MSPIVVILVHEGSLKSVLLDAALLAIRKCITLTENEFPIKELIKHYETEGIYCPTITLFPSKKLITLKYDCWGKVVDISFTINFLGQSITSQFTGGEPMKKSLHDLKRMKASVIYYLGGPPCQQQEAS